MRVLLADHFPLNGPRGPTYTRLLAEALIDLGHAAAAVVVDDKVAAEPEAFPVRRVICKAGYPQADLAFGLPTFSSTALDQTSFETLSDRQLSDYRHVLRRALDDVVDKFNPDIIHAQHIWVLGQLALETGVPYVLTAWPEELRAVADARYRALADQAADNAGRIFVADCDLAAMVLASFEGAAERNIVALDSTGSGNGEPMDVSMRDTIVAGYQEVLQQRFG